LNKRYKYQELAERGAGGFGCVGWGRWGEGNLEAEKPESTGTFEPMDDSVSPPGRLQYSTELVTPTEKAGFLFLVSPCRGRTADPCYKPERVEEKSPFSEAPFLVLCPPM
jgi:hypothetical protein